MELGVLECRRVRSRVFLRSAALVLVFAAAACLGSFAQQPIPDSAVVVDTHADTPTRITDENFDLLVTPALDIGICGKPVRETWEPSFSLFMSKPPPIEDTMRAGRWT